MNQVITADHINKLHVKIADANDAALLAAIARQCFYDTYAWYNTKENMDAYLTKEFTEQVFAEYLQTAENTFYILYNNTEVAGFAQVKEKSLPSFNEPEALEITRFYAVKSMIGKGIGKELMQLCIDHAQSKNKKILWLIVWQKNQRAINFYKKWGFEIFGVHDFVLGNDVQKDWLMKKEL